MTSVGYATLQVIPSAQGFGSALTKQTSAATATAGTAAGAAGGKAFGGGMMAAAGKVAGPLAAIFAVGSLVSFGKNSALASEAAETANNRLTQTLSNAGDATGAWSARQQDLAESLGKQVGVQDEVIKQGQAILGTFHAVAGTAGDAGSTFDRATLAAVDLSAAGFGSVESASTQLGKALQDPATGLTALTRVGVSFTDAEKEKIKALQESGDMLGAQDVLLKAIEGQVQGTATATADTSARMAVAWQNVQEKAGGVFRKVFEPLANFAIDTLFPVLEKVADFIGGLFDGAGDGGGALGGIGESLAGLGAAFSDLMEAAKPVFDFLMEVLGPVFRSLIDGFVARLQGLIEIVSGIFASVGPILLGWITSAWNAIVNGIRERIDAIRSLVSAGWEAVKSLVSSALEAVKGFVTGAWNAIVGFISGAISRVRSAVSSGFESARSAVSSAMSSISGAVSSGISGVVGFFLSLPGRIIGALGNVASRLYSVGADIIRGLINGITGMVGAAVRAVQDAVGSVISGAKNLLGINSPSKVFAGFGANIGEGLVVGLDGQRRAVRGAYEGLLTPSGAALPGPAIGGLDGAPGASGGGRGPLVGTLVVHNPIAEPASTTLQRQVSKVATVGLFA
jgi:phage-related protein